MIDILMATYNGEKYLSEQIESILRQTHDDYRILIRDDGSKDGTVDIIREYEKKYPRKIMLIEDDVKCGSSASNFMQLTKYATSEYVMYCDQDDIWLENKIEVSFNKMLEIEKEIGNGKPVLIFSSYQLVDENLSEIKMNKKSNQISACNLELNRLLVQNYVTGCLMMCNKALYSMAGDYKKEILMHDWWLALIASAMGSICHIPDITTLYRQHGNNIVGAVNVKSMSYRLAKIKDKETRLKKYKYRDQAKLFLKRYHDKLDTSQSRIIEEFVNIFSVNKIRRIIKLLNGNYLKSDLVRIIGQLWYI